MADLAALANSKPELAAQLVRPLGGDRFVVRFPGIPTAMTVTSKSHNWANVVEVAGEKQFGAHADAAAALRALTNQPVALEWTRNAWPILQAMARPDGTLSRPVVARVPAENVFARLWHALCHLFDRHYYMQDHAYAVLGIGENKDLGKYVTVYNPLGHTEGREDGPDDGVFRVPLAEFIQTFDAIAYDIC